MNMSIFDKDESNSNNTEELVASISKVQDELVKYTLRLLICAACRALIELEDSVKDEKERK